MRKKLIALLLLCTVFCLCSSFTAAAETGLGYVTDQAGILSDEQEQALTETAEGLTQRYGVSFYIVTVQDYRDYDASGVDNCAEGLYSYYDLGSGPDRDGVLLLLSMSDRDYSLTTYGFFADYCFGDPNKNLVEAAFLDNFRNNDWMGGFGDYLSQCDDVMATAAQHHLSKDSEPCSYNGIAYPNKTYVYGDLRESAEPVKMPLGMKLLIGIGAPCLIALIVCSTFKAQMKTAKLRTTAEEYVVPGSMALRASDDRFVNRSVTRVPIPKNNNSSGRGGFSGGGSGGFHSHTGKF